MTVCTLRWRTYLENVRKRTREVGGGPKIGEIECTYFLNGPLGSLHVVLNVPRTVFSTLAIFIISMPAVCVQMPFPVPGSRCWQ